MKLFLSHERTKADLTEYLAKMILEYNKHSEKVLIIFDANYELNRDFQ